MSKASSGTKGGAGSHRSRLALYLSIGFFMASLAIGGYGMFGPRAKAAETASHKPADIAINAATATAIGPAKATSPLTVAPPTSNAFVVNTGDQNARDLASVQAEIDAITHQITSLQAQMVKQGLAP